MNIPRTFPAASAGPEPRSGGSMEMSLQSAELAALLQIAGPSVGGKQAAIRSPRRHNSLTWAPWTQGWSWGISMVQNGGNIFF